MTKERYNPAETEKKWQKYWEEEKIYAFNPDSDKEIYSIDTPPPTVSGKMHMGHAFGNSQQDFFARVKRMQGYNVLQPFGTDDNGLPTLLLIQKTKKVLANKLGRKAFRELTIKTLKEELRPRFQEDWKRMGISCDFNINYTTIDKNSQRISQQSFIDLYKQGRQYRVEAAAMHCPKCQTAISQVELEDKELASTFNDIAFTVEGKQVIIGTTRPELLPACVALFYNPEDKRYQKLKGKNATVPLFNFNVPVLADKRVDLEKGTGLVMSCTFGDQTDIEWQKAYRLPIKKAISRDGTLTVIAGPYKGQKVEEARKNILTDLKKKKQLTSQKPITHTVNTHDRCGTPIEFIHSKQWFIKYLDLKKEMLKWGEELNWIPQHMKNRYDNWAKGLQWDWCISRQIAFGVPFPVWYCDDCDEIILAQEKNLPVDPVEDKAPVDTCPKCKSKKISGETDIINTWATSALTPTIVKEQFKGTKAYDKIKDTPMNMRPMGHDIISFWLFNSVVKSQLHYKMKPWNDCYINGWMLDSKGKKMSKSKGNIIEPQDMIQKYSADALRYLAAGSKTGEDVPFQEKNLLTGQKTITKLYNAAKFIFMNLEDFDKKSAPALQALDNATLSKLHTLIATSSARWVDYDYASPLRELDQFFWKYYCDNYLELVKDRIYNNREGKESAQYTLYHTFYTILQLYAPIMPHITEELYQKYYAKDKKEKSIHVTTWPETNKKLINKKTEEATSYILSIIEAGRKYKAQEQVSMKKAIIAKIGRGEHAEKELAPYLDDLKAVLNAETLELIDGTEHNFELVKE